MPAPSRKLFERLLAAGAEDEVQAILDSEGLATDASKWTPYGDNEAFYGVVENQQAHPIPALVEKITNGIDAILEKKVRQEGIDIRSSEAPSSVREALDRCFPDHRNWDVGDARRRQARELQIVASGPKRDTSLLIYDDGVGHARGLRRDVPVAASRQQERCPLRAGQVQHGRRGRDRVLRRPALPARREPALRPVLAPGLHPAAPPPAGARRRRRPQEHVVRIPSVRRPRRQRRHRDFRHWS